MTVPGSAVQPRTTGVQVVHEVQIEVEQPVGEGVLDCSGYGAEDQRQLGPMENCERLVKSTT